MSKEAESAQAEEKKAGHWTQAHLEELLRIQSTDLLRISLENAFAAGRKEGIEMSAEAISKQHGQLNRTFDQKDRWEIKHGLNHELDGLERAYKAVRALLYEGEEK